MVWPKKLVIQDGGELHWKTQRINPNNISFIGSFLLYGPVYRPVAVTKAVSDIIRLYMVQHVFDVVISMSNTIVEEYEQCLCNPRLMAAASHCSADLFSVYCCPIARHSDLWW